MQNAFSHAFWLGAEPGDLLFKTVIGESDPRYVACSGTDVDRSSMLEPLWQQCSELVFPVACPPLEIPTRSAIEKQRIGPNKLHPLLQG